MVFTKEFWIERKEELCNKMKGKKHNDGFKKYKSEQMKGKRNALEHICTQEMRKRMGEGVKKQGYEILRLWESDIIDDKDKCVEKIINFAGSISDAKKVEEECLYVNDY